MSPKPILRSNGKFLRDYLYIDDVVNGYILIGKQMIKSNKLNGLAINFGSGKPITVINLVKIILNILNKKRDYFIIKNNAQNEIKDQYSGYKFAKNKINWKPRISLKEGILRTYSWYKNKNRRI